MNQPGPGSSKDLEKKSLSNVQRMREKLCSMARLIELSGAVVKPFSDPGLTHFSALAVDRQDAVLADLDITIDLLDSTLKDGHSLLDSGQLLAR
jgi:hypothetical protein